MAPTTTQTNLISSNEKYASGFKQGHLASPPGKKYTILTCMDARIDPAAAFGIELGDAHVIRNAGGAAHDALRSIIISEQMLGTTEILLIKHTKCGMATFKNEDAYLKIEQQVSPEAAAELREGKFEFHPFTDLDQAVRSDVEYLRNSKAIPKSVVISGWVYDVVTGKVREVA